MRIVLVFSMLLSALSMSADTLLVANRGGSTITLVDATTMKSLGTVTVGNDPHEIAVSPDGARAYVSNYGKRQGTTISVVDIATRTKVRDISIAPLKGPHGITFNSGRVWFTADGSQEVGRIDPVAGVVDWSAKTTQTGGHMLVVKSDGATVATANIDSHSTSILNVTDGTVKVVEAAPQVEGIALSPNERELWLGSRSFGGIAIIDLETQTRVAQVDQGMPAYRLVFSPDGRFVVAPRGPQIVVYDAAARKQVRTIDVEGFPLSVLFSRDGALLYVAVAEPHRVHKIDFASGHTLASADVDPVPDGLALASPPVSGKRRRAVKK
jgi:YVTN family beta-propeller protein